MANAEKSPQKVNPVLLIVLGVAVLAVGINYIVSRPKTSPVTAPVQTPVAAAVDQQGQESPASSTSLTVDPNNPAVATEDVQRVDPLSGQKIESTKSLSRNPFLTPFMYLKESPGSTPNNTQTPPNNQNNNSDREKTPTSSNVNNGTETTVEPKNEFRLGAVFQKPHDKVALIYLNGKGYILRENDALKGTNYRIKTINRTSVTLINDIGEEEVLALVEKTVTVKLKGGGQ